MADLSGYTSIRTNIFVRLAIDEYRTSSGGSYTSQVLRFSDSTDSDSLNGETYTPLGRLLGVTQTTSEMRPSNDTVTVSISGIPTNAIEEIRYSKIKGSNIKIYRKFYNISTGNAIETQGYFFGRVNNYSLQEEYEVESRTASNIILLECSSAVSLLEQKFAGRKTNPNSEKRFYPSDTSMDRVPALVGTKFDFGAP